MAAGGGAVLPDNAKTKRAEALLDCRFPLVLVEED